MRILAIILGTILLAIVGGISYVVFDAKLGFKDKRLDSDFHLINQDGAEFTSNSLRGSPSIVFFGFTNCSKVCPTTLSTLDRWLKQVDPTNTLLRAYFITVDPKRDTPDVMKKFVKKFSDRIIGVSGDPTSVMSIAKKFHIYVNNAVADNSDVKKQSPVSHTASLLLFNSHGSIVGVIPYKEDSNTAIQKINRLIAEDKSVK
ncbi:MAG: SCO family protein [Candidatus Liberibacter ctenarytainae]|uniref:SCO family protein n=1 Tax=Candidatus Liberibacter ctenarytainae TaxID=2020335 RepID=A0A937ACG5_9HYPH|nr:SCO family protein [Candidatus Liberibacter ctenarytainae]